MTAPTGNFGRLVERALASVNQAATAAALAREPDAALRRLYKDAQKILCAENVLMELVTKLYGDETDLSRFPMYASLTELAVASLVAYEAGAKRGMKASNQIRAKAEREVYELTRDICAEATGKLRCIDRRTS